MSRASPASSRLRPGLRIGLLAAMLVTLAAGECNGPNRMPPASNTGSDVGKGAGDNERGY